MYFGGVRVGADWYCSVPVVLLQSEFGGIAVSKGRFYRQGLVALQCHQGGFTVQVWQYCGVPREVLQSGLGGTVAPLWRFYRPRLVVFRCRWRCHSSRQLHRYH